MNRAWDIFLVSILGMLAGLWIASYYWTNTLPPVLDTRAAYCRGYIEGRSAQAARPSDEEACLNNIVTGKANFEEMGLKGPLLP